MSEYNRAGYRIGLRRKQSIMKINRNTVYLELRSCIKTARIVAIVTFSSELRFFKSKYQRFSFNGHAQYHCQKRVVTRL